MKYAIIYGSRTGNTKRLADALRAALPQEECVCFAAAGETEAESIAQAELVLVGFWTDKGCCDEETQKFLEGLEHKTVFLFGTAGFGQDKQYYERILSTVWNCADDASRLSGSFMCQGEMPDSVGARYQKMLKDNPDDAGAQQMLHNFKTAVGHPDAADCLACVEAARRALEG